MWFNLQRFRSKIINLSFGRMHFSCDVYISLIPLAFKRGEQISSALLTLSRRFQLHLTAHAAAITTISEVEISEIYLRKTVLENLSRDRLKQILYLGNWSVCDFPYSLD